MDLTTARDNPMGNGPEEKRSLTDFRSQIIYWVGVAMAVYHLWVNTVGVVPEIQRNAIHYGFILFLGYLLFPIGHRLTPVRGFFDYFLSILSFITGLYLVFFEGALHLRNEVVSRTDILFAIFSVLLLIEITRRTAGTIIPVIAVFFLGYALWFGRFFSGIWHFPGFTIERMLYRLYFAPDGIFHSPNPLHLIRL